MNNKIKQICMCGHPLDNHIEQINGKAEAGECILCDCYYYLEDKRCNKPIIQKSITRNNTLELLKDIRKQGFNYHCSCPTCIKIRDKISIELCEEKE